MVLTYNELRKLWALPSDIKARKRRIAKLEDLLAREPETASETVKSSMDAGNATIICHATVRGRVPRGPLEDELRQLRREMEQKNALYQQLLPLAYAAIESIPDEDADIRTAISMLFVDGCTWGEVEHELGGSASGWRKRVGTYMKNHADTFKLT